MWDANKAFLHECSSDYHMGQLGGGKNVSEMWSHKFRGQNIVAAMLKHLIQVQGLGTKSKNETVVFGGTSAGGVGAIPHLDHVANFLKPYNVKVLGYFDSPLYFDLKPLHNSTTGLYQRMKQAFSLFQESNSEN